MEKQVTAADVVGMQAAFAAAINALIATHPDPARLAAMLQFEKQETLSALLAMPIPDRTIESFHTAWELMTRAPQDA